MPSPCAHPVHRARARRAPTMLVGRLLSARHETLPAAAPEERNEDGTCLKTWKKPNSTDEVENVFRFAQGVGTPRHVCFGASSTKEWLETEAFSSPLEKSKQFQCARYPPGAPVSVV